MKRKVCRLIALLICISFMLPYNNCIGQGFVKDIDIKTNDMDIEIQGKKLTVYRQPFIYENQIWVSISDLAQKLGIKCTYDGTKENLYIYTNKAMNKDKALNSYRRGYEIEAKENIINSIEEEIEKNKQNNKKSTINLKEKTIRICCRDIQFYVDGKKIKLSTNPILYENRIYIPIEELSRYLYFTPCYDSQTNTLKIDANGVLLENNKYSKMDNLLTFRKNRNHLLDLKLERTEDKKNAIKNLNIPYADINSLRTLKKYLNNNFNHLEKIPVKFKVTQPTYKSIYLEIKFSSWKMSNWYNLSRKDVENWAWDICTAILNLYNPNVEVNGSIRNPYYSRYSSSKYKNLVTFETKKDDVDFDFTRSRLKRDYKVDVDYLIDKLNKDLDEYFKEDFSYEGYMSGDDINLTIHCSSNYIKHWSLHTKIGYLRSLKWEIKNMFPDINVNGKIIFSDKDIKPFKFLLEHDNEYSTDLLKETEECIQDRYGSFYYRGNTFNLKYNLYELDEDKLKLIVEVDCSIDDNKLGNNALTKINSRVRSAINYVESVWDIDVIGEVVDENDEIIKEF